MSLGRVLVCLMRGQPLVMGVSIGRLKWLCCALLIACAQVQVRAQLCLVAQLPATNSPTPGVVPLGWNPSPDTRATGYFLYWGLASGACTNFLDVGNVTNAIVAGIAAGTRYYFTIVTYDAAGDQSPPSNEALYSGIAMPTVTWPAPDDIVYGTVLSAAQLDASSSVPRTFTYNPPAGTVLSAGSNQTLSVIFNPTDSGDYVCVTNTVSINVLKAPLTITANTTNKVYGQTVTFSGTEFSSSGLVNTDTVSSVTLTSAGAGSTATVGGSPYFIVPSGAVGAGLGNYTIRYAEGTLTVSKVSASGVLAALAWPAPADIVYGTALGAAELDASSSVPGTFTYNPTAGTVLSAGSNQTLSVTFDPTDTGDYVCVTNTVSINVLKAPLTITANGMNKVYGQTVSFAGTEFSSSGLVNTDTVSSVTLTSAGAWATARVAGSPYPIVPSAPVGTGLSNYTISCINGALTISKFGGYSAALVTGTVTPMIRRDNSASASLTLSNLGAGVYAITGFSAPGSTNRVLFVDDLSGTNWQTLGTATANLSGVFRLMDTNTSAHRSYRSVYP